MAGSIPMSDALSILYAPLTLRDYWEILRLPVLLAVVAIAGTWAIWYLTSSTCSADLALATGCNQSATAQFVNLEALNKMVTHAAIGGGGGGLWSFAMITRQRRAIEAMTQALEAERQAREAEQHAREAEQRAREIAESLLTEERQRADEERQQFLAIIEELRANHNGAATAQDEDKDPAP